MKTRTIWILVIAVLLAWVAFVVSVLVFTAKPADAGPFSGAKIHHHNPDNGWHPPIVIICQSSGDKYYLYEGDSSPKGCDVGKVFMYANSSLVYKINDSWYTWATNHSDTGYYKDVYNGTDDDMAEKRAS